MEPSLSQEYIIRDASIIADRLGDEEYNITNYIIELSFFEDIELPYITAQMICMDDIGLFSDIKLYGTEQIRFIIESSEESSGYADSSTPLRFEITLNLVSILLSNKVSDRSELYHLNLISPHAYRDANIKISRSYTGKLELIAEAVLKNHLDVDVDISYSGVATSAQKPARVIIPYLSPLESVEWLLDRVTTKIGAPFFVYQTLYDQVEGRDKLRFGSLENMVTQTPFNEELPLIYSAARASGVAAGGTSDQGVTVKKLRVENIQDTLKMMRDGALGADLLTVDTFTGDEFKKHFSIKDQIERMQDLEIIPYGADQNIYDDKQQIEFSTGNKSPHECSSRNYASITSYGTYGYFNSYHDTSSQSEATNKLRGPAMKSMFEKNTIDVIIPGITFLAALADGNSGVSVGDVVVVDFLNSDVDQDIGGALNKELSGKYLIHRCRNVFIDTKHEIVASISKVSSKGEF